MRKSVDESAKVLFVALLVVLLLCFPSVLEVKSDELPAKSEDWLVQSPLLEARSKLLKRMLEVEKQGVGIKAYRDFFNRIEAAVVEGQSEAIIKPKLEQLSRAIEQQLSTRDQIQGLWTNAEDKIWKPYCMELVRRVRANWHPSVPKSSYAVVVKYQVLRDGMLGRYSVSRSSGNAQLDQEAINAVKRTSPHLPWPTTPEDNRIEFEQTFQCNKR